MVYRANSGPLPKADDKELKVIPNDPSTKPVSIGPPRNRKEALLSRWWKGYYEAEEVEMESHRKNGTWI